MRAVSKYWVIYYLVYVVCVAILTWLHRDSPEWDNYIYLTAAIFGTSVGIALLFAIISEVVGRMVLLIPDAVKNLIEKGRKEQRDRLNEAYRRFGIEVDGVLTLPRTQEVEDFLSGKTN